MNNLLSLQFRLTSLTLLILGWLVIYFPINRLAIQSTKHIQMNIGLDEKIPFIPQFAIIYFSTYIFVVQPFLFLPNEQQFIRMLITFSGISILSSLLHAVVPSKIERVNSIDPSNLSGRLLNLFQNTCQPYGNFPSMHVGLSVPVVAINYLTGGLFVGSFTLIWAILIALSTLFTKQHYILDVVAGIIIGMVVFVATFYFFPI